MQGRTINVALDVFQNIQCESRTFLFSKNTKKKQKNFALDETWALHYS